MVNFMTVIISVDFLKSLTISNPNLRLHIKAPVRASSNFLGFLVKYASQTPKKARAASFEMAKNF